jgi:hypothetical protein
MADFVVIYDPTLELGSIVDLDTLTSWGPVYKGPDAQEILQGFLDAAPFDVSILTTEQAVKLFWSLGQTIDTPATAETGADSNGTVADATGGLGTDAAAAEAEAHAATTIPDVQPADTDTVQAAADQETVPVGDPPSPATATVDRPTGQEPGATSKWVYCQLCNADEANNPDPGCVACKGAGGFVVPV